MLTHKEVNTFIRKYNKHVVIKGYSKMKLANKVALVENRLKEKKGGKYGRPSSKKRRLIEKVVNAKIFLYMSNSSFSF
eukprot:SAG22_NODE_697_length_7825_cov_8.757831_3_plen_78_part_00